MCGISRTQNQTWIFVSHFVFIKKIFIYFLVDVVFCATAFQKLCCLCCFPSNRARARERKNVRESVRDRERKRPRAPRARERERERARARERQTHRPAQSCRDCCCRKEVKSLEYFGCIPIPTWRNLELQTRHSKCWRRCFPTCSVQLLCYVYWRRSCFFCCSAGDRHEELLQQKAETCGSMMMSCSNSALGGNNCLQVQWVCHWSEKPCTTAGAWKLLSQLSWLIIARSKSCTVVEELLLPKNHEV